MHSKAISTLNCLFLHTYAHTHTRTHSHTHTHVHARTPHGFKLHVEEEHNLDYYLFFFMHLLHKPVTEHTGQESYVYDLYRKRDFNFFPVGECFRDAAASNDHESECV